MTDGMPARRWTDCACQGRWRGFTIVELLVVIAILGLLSAMLLPSLSRARLLAKRVACANNLRVLGSAAATYQVEQNDYVPVCWGNLDPRFPNPWKSWRTRLLAYVTDYEVLNCPAGRDTGELGEVFHSVEEVTGYQREGTVNAGSYGTMEQYSLPSFKAANHVGAVKRGHPVWTNAFSTVPGVAWRDPFNSIYVADSGLCKGLVSYPSESHGAYGTSVVRPPSEPGYFGVSVSRRFADRHVGTNCLFLGGHVLNYETRLLDKMVAGEANCVWDVE